MKLVWDKSGERYYESGVSKGVLFPWDSENNKWGKGVAWNGLTNVTESPDGAEPTDFWADNMKYASMRSAETLSGSIQAYTYPDEFAPCDGSAEVLDGIFIGQQTRIPFCISYRTEIGNDQTSEAGYKIHIVYNATASPSERAYDTINDSPDAADLSWDFDTTPINVTGHKATASIVIDSRGVSKEHLAAIEAKLYGTNGSTEGEDGDAPTLLLPDEIIALVG